MRGLLLVEGDPEVRQLLEHVLLSGGYKVDTAATFVDAERFVDSRLYDLVVTDAKLPDGSGIAIADKAEARGMGTLVITDDALRLPTGELERHDYVMKPVRPSELPRVINWHFGTRPT
jgi:DNA-binding response OmpR family regulator